MKPTRYFWDCEFLEDNPIRNPVYLLSIALVCEDGRELACVNSECPVGKANAWVRANVLPHVNWRGAVPVATIREQIRTFVTGTPEFWGLNGSYDWVVLCGVFGSMLELPEGWPHYFNEIKQLERQLGVTKEQRPARASGTEHDPLEDARWHKQLYDHWRGVAAERGVPV